MKLFVPAVGYRIKLTQDWTFALHDESRNRTLQELLVKGMEKIHPHYKTTYVVYPDKEPVTLPANTILEVDRVYVRNVNKTAESADDDFDSLTFRVIEHPTLDAKKKIRFWAKLSDVNTIEYELPPDHTIGKEQAVVNAKKPKKLNPERCRTLVSHGINLVEARGYGRNLPKPAWLTSDLIKDMRSIGDEYMRVREPWERAQWEAAVAKRNAELELQLKSGSLSIPIGLADKIKTVEDLKKHGMYSHYRDEFEMRCCNWEYVINYRIMSGYNAGAVVFDRMSAGTRCRTFRAKDTVSSPYGKDGPTIEHMWIRVFSDTDDLEIVKVEAGFDEAKP